MEHGKVEVFETPDVPEVAQPSNVDLIPEGQNDNIDHAPVSADAAFKKFADKTLDTSLQDYSDSLVKRRRAGLVRNQTEFELAEAGGPGADETPLQRFHRLQYEVKALADELNQKKAAPAETSGQQAGAAPPAGNTDDVLGELRLLERQLRGLLDDPSVLPVLRPTHLDTAKQQELTGKLVGEIQAIAGRPTPADAAPTPASAAPRQAAAPAASAGASSGTPAGAAQLARVADLERRLDELERVLGPAPDASAAVGAPTGGLVAAVEHLRERFAMLGVSSIEQLQRRLKVLNQEIDATLKKSQANLAPMVSPHDKKVSEMFEMMNRWDTYASQVPSIVSRLHALKDLHMAATAFRQQTQQLAAEQERIAKQLQAQRDIAAQVQTSLSTNMATVQSNVTNLDERFAALNKRLETLKL